MGLCAQTLCNRRDSIGHIQPSITSERSCLLCLMTSINNSCDGNIGNTLKKRSIFQLHESLSSVATGYKNLSNTVLYL